MKFLCDAMLGHIGKRLRSAGYDTLISKGEWSDQALASLANQQDRILISCNRKLKDFAIYNSANDESSWTLLLSEKLALDWLFAPFTRCLDCNTTLEQTKSVAPTGELAVYCPSCDKVFWQGSHVARMRRRLEENNFNSPVRHSATSV